MTTISIPIPSLAKTADAFAALLGGPDARLQDETAEAFVTRVLTAYVDRVTREHQAEAAAAAVRAAVLDGTDPVAAVAAAVGTRAKA